MATSKRFKKASEGVDADKSYTVEEAVKLVKARATANLTRYRGEKTGPHYESYFMRANNGATGEAFWIRYTIYQPDQLSSFLEEQSQIVPSPGIDISYYYATHAGKFVAELDLFYTFFKKPIIAITGSVGKTTITRTNKAFF